MTPCLPSGSYYIMADVTGLMKKYSRENDVEFSKELIEHVGMVTVHD